MYDYEYYTTRRGEQPVRDWLESLPPAPRMTMRNRIAKFSEEGLKLLTTEMLARIDGFGPDFFELRGGSLRIGIYLHRARNKFILLHGWRKKKQRQPKDIQMAYRRLTDYLAN